MDRAYWQSAPSAPACRSRLIEKNSTSSVSPAMRVCCLLKSEVEAVSREYRVKGIDLAGRMEGKFTKLG